MRQKNEQHHKLSAFIRTKWNFYDFYQALFGGCFLDGRILNTLITKAADASKKLICA